jgi:uncharacterized membrane protein
MRKMLEAVSLAALADMIWCTSRALQGPNHLPDKIPTHFNLAGQPDGWGSTAMLLLLPALTVAIYLLITVVALFPSVFNYPVRVTAANRPRLQALALQMIAWLKTELVCILALIQISTIAVARRHSVGLNPALLPVSIVVVFTTIGWYFVAMRRAAHAESGA